MAAKKGKGWRSGRREGRSRMVQMTRHLVVSEGKETEPRYFEGVRAALGAANGRKVAIVVKVCFATLIFRFSRLIFFGFHVSRQGRTANFPNLRTCPS